MPQKKKKKDQHTSTRLAPDAKQRPIETSRLKFLDPKDIKKEEKRSHIPVKKEHLKVTPKEVYTIPESEKFQWMYFKDIPTTYEDYKQKKKFWPGFSYALMKIGLDNRDIALRILEGKTPWKNEDEQRQRCLKARDKFLKQQGEVRRFKEDEIVSTTKIAPWREKERQPAKVKEEPANKPKHQEKRTPAQEISLKSRQEREKEKERQEKEKERQEKKEKERQEKKEKERREKKEK